MKRFLIAIALTCVLSSSAFAGLIPTDGSPAPAPNPTPATATSPGETQTPPGDIPSGGRSEQVSSDALSALLSAFSFLVV